MGKFTGKEKPSFIADLVEKKPTHEYTPTHTPVVKERKSHRLNVLMRPSTVEALKVYCKRQDVSMGDIINQLVEEFLDKNV